MDMPKKNHIFIFALCICFSLSVSQAEVLPIDFTNNNAASTSEPTLTFLWKSDQAKATLILIPGGEGQVRLSLDRADLGGFYGNILKPLSNPKITSGLFNVVIFDSPTILENVNGYTISRTTVDHLSRIESVVRFYKDRFNKPVWLMGHSSGAVSVTEFYKYLQKTHNEDIVSAIIFSSGRNGARFNADTNLTVLVLAHKYDRCQKSTNASSFDMYSELIKTNKEKTKYVLIYSGDSESKDPCRSGHHMFFNAQEEVYKAIDDFASEVLK